MATARRQVEGAARADVLIVAGFVVGAAVVRVTALGPEALWIDDAWVAYAHRSSWANITEIGLTAPGLSIILKLWFGIAGFGEIRAQLIPFLAGVTAPALAYGLLRSRTGRLAAMLAAGWLLLSPIHVVYSGRVKQYTLEVVLALVIIHVAWRLLEDSECTDRWRTLSIVSSLAVLFSFPLASVAGAACAVTALSSVAWSRRVRPAVCWLLVPAVTTIAWFAIVIRHRQYGGLRSFWKAQFVQTDAGLLVLLESIAVRAKDMFEFVSPVSPILTMTTVALLFIWLTWSKPLHALIVGLPLVGAVVLAATESAPLGGGRTDLYLLAGLIFGSAVALDDLLDRAPSRIRGATAVVAAVAAVAALVGHDQPGYPSQDVPTVLAELVDKRQPGETIFVYHNTKWALATYSDFDVTIRPISNPYDVVFDDPSIIRQHFPSSPERITSDIKQVDSASSAWLIGSHFEPTWQSTIDEFLAAGWTEIDRTTATGAELILFEQP